MCLHIKEGKAPPPESTTSLSRIAPPAEIYEKGELTCVNLRIMAEDGRAASRPTRPSRRSSGARSRASSAAGSGLQRLRSGTYLDDQSHHATYHDVHHDGTVGAESASTSSDESSSDEEKDPREEGDVDDEMALEDDTAEVAPEVIDGIAAERDVDVEKARKMERKKSRSQARDPNLVTWEGPDDPANPKNWSMGRKWAATFVVSSFTLISPVSSSMIAPALPAIGAQFHITDQVQLSLTLSIFLLAYAIGPLFMGPLSEMYGRARVLQLANLLYFFFNLGCALAQSKGQLMAFRFLAGLGGSAPLAIGGGVLSDLFTADQRGKAISIYSLAPLLGPAIG